jgi:hypothetical protein
VSPDGTFYYGFIQAGHDGDNAFSFSVWFTAAKDGAVIWTANPDAPVNDRDSTISFRRDGELALVDTNGTTVWASRTGGGGRGLTISLRDTGNLVIEDLSTGRAVWRSFDWPTDMLLPSQRFTKDTKLVAGYFTLYYDNNSVLRMFYNDGPDIASIYWLMTRTPSMASCEKEGEREDKKIEKGKKRRGKTVILRGFSLINLVDIIF